MIHECPSCKIRSYDDIKPHTNIDNPLCVFCVGTHTQKELLNWQMQHLKEMETKNHYTVLKHYYFYMDNEIKNIYTLIQDIKRMFSDKEEKEDSR